VKGKGLSNQCTITFYSMSSPTGELLSNQCSIGCLSANGVGNKCAIGFDKKGPDLEIGCCPSKGVVDRFKVKFFRKVFFVHCKMSPPRAQLLASGSKKVHYCTSWGAGSNRATTRVRGISFRFFLLSCLWRFDLDCADSGHGRSSRPFHSLHSRWPLWKEQP